MDNVLSWINNIKATYNVNPYIFAIIYVVGMPPFWYGFYKIIICLKNKDTASLMKWLLVSGVSLVAPFVYVAIFGRNLPVWVWVAMGIVIALSIVSSVSKLKKKHAITEKSAVEQP
jgi:hypothetical protein